MQQLTPKQDATMMLLQDCHSNIDLVHVQEKDIIITEDILSFSLNQTHEI
jgi:hypothetical protein